MTQIGFFPGCSLKGTSSEYAQSIFTLSKMVGINLVEIEDWNCCGASTVHNINNKLSVTLPARILTLAKQQKLTEIVAPCAACYNRLCIAQHQLKINKFLRNQLFETFQICIDNNISILNIIQYIEKYIFEKIKEKIIYFFKYPVVCYYGCLLVRPHKILNFDRLEDPQSMDNLMKKIGALPIDWAYKTECCGGGFSVSRTDIVVKLCGEIIKDAINKGAEAIIVACPMCQSNLDTRRSCINNYLHKKTNIPVIYITQAIGLAIGIKKKDLGFKKLFVKPTFI
ncbi:MAG: CoB--CoM heterodisulfide reductase iron-sulfur subunit B family protein [Bacteroidales bacterium OttesenSCG-928-I14]|jgi:heterodisulfide reductase subunit B|nr:CoB--CoM heterodisulfide reductase iron-sulfur subunit B family protein [Bacteroidales bacterium OttesenSCG-928-I14]